MDIEKIKSKIEKLLNLALSDNENESSMALQKAIELMEKYQIDQDDIYKQKIISKRIIMDSYILQDWEITLFSNLGTISGCYSVYAQGFKLYNKYAYIILTGKESDIINLEYLLIILRNIIRKKSNKFKMELRKDIFRDKKGKTNASALSSYRFGLLDSICKKIEQERNTFFREYKSQHKEFELVPVDTRYKEAEDFFKENNNSKIIIATKNNTLESEFYNYGKEDGKTISLYNGMDNKSETGPIMIQNKN